MRRKMMLMSLLFAGCVFISGNAFAAWTQAKGHSYNQLTLSHYKTTSKYTTIEKDVNDNVLTVNAKPYKTSEEEFTSTKVSYYLEYGLKDELTIIFSGGWDWVKSNDIDRYGDDEYVSGIGDIILGLRQKLSDNIGGGVLMSLEGDIKIPELYKYENPVTHQNLGDGQYDYRLKLKFGRGFSWGYSVIDVGYKYRDYNKQLEDDGLFFKPSDQYFISLSGGYNAATWLSIRGKLEWSGAIGNASVSDGYITYAACCGVDKGYERSVLILDTLGLEQDHLSAGLALAFTVAKNTQVVLSYDTTLSGFDPVKTANASHGETWSLALAYMH